MKRTLFLLIMPATLSAIGQQIPTEQIQPIIAEAKLLYNSEMASWLGSDLFYENYKKDDVGGYFSYSDSGFTKCIFYSNAERPKVIGAVRFDTTYDSGSAGLDLNERDFTPTENEFYQLREKALDEIDADTLFKLYPNTDLNLVPVINGNERKVYVLTVSQQDSVVLLGNDYLLVFNFGNKVLLKKKLHQDLIPVYYDEKNGKQAEEARHTHSPESGDFITATDICTLMLYEKFMKLKTYRVDSKRYLSTWNCETGQLTVMAKSTEEKANQDISIDAEIRIKADKYQVRNCKKRGQTE